MLLFSLEASDIEAQHCELLKVHHFDFVSPCFVEPRVCCVILFVEGGVRLLLIPTILLWQGFDVFHLSVIVVSITADVIVAPLLYLITVSAIHQDIFYLSSISCVENSILLFSPHFTVLPLYHV